MKSLNKRAALSTKMLAGAIESIVLLVVILLLYSVLVPEAQTAGDTLNASGVPLGSLFASNGVVFVIIMAALILVIIAAFLKFNKK